MAKDKQKAARKGVAVSAAFTQEQAISQFAKWLTKIPDLDGVLRKAGVKRHQLESLLDDDEVAQAVETRVDALLSVPFRLNPSEGPAADFLIDQMSKHIQSIVRSAINARFYGYNVQEAIYEKDGEITNENGYRGFNRIIEKPMEWFEPRNNGELRYFPDNGLHGMEGELVDQEFKFFLTRNNPTYKRPLGQALFSKLYWAVYYRTNAWKFWGKDLERFGSPILVGKTAGEVQEMVDALLAAHNSAVVGIDAEDSVEALAVNSNGGRSFEAIETAIIRRINKLVLGQTLTSGTDGGSGNRALGEVHDNVRTDKRNSDIRLVLPTVQRAVDALCKINGLPRHEVTLADGKGLEEERAKRDKDLNEIGVEFNEQYFQDEYNLDANHFKVRTSAQTEPAKTFSAVPQQKFSFKASSQQITPQQQEIDNLAPDSYSLLDVDQIKSIVADSETPEQLAEKLFAAIPDAPLEQFNDVLAQALYTADVLGYKHSSEGD